MNILKEAVLRLRQKQESPVLPEVGRTALKLLLQQPGQTGLIRGENLPPGGYPAHILHKNDSMTIVRRNTYYERDPFEYPMGTDQTIRETCQIICSI